MKMDVNFPWQSKKLLPEIDSKNVKQYNNELSRDLYEILYEEKPIFYERTHLWDMSFILICLTIRSI